MTNIATRAVILARGLGRRMQRVDEGDAALDAAQAAAATRGAKAMMPDARGRPFLDHVLSALADGGITDVCVVIGPGDSAIRDHYAAQPLRRVVLAYAVQHEPTGTADALLAAELWTATQDFLTLNADNLYPVAAVRALATLGGPGLVAFDSATLVRDSNIEPERIAAFAVVRIRADGTLADITEKPSADALRVAKGASWVSMNLWRFDQAIFAACRDVSVSARGERELPEAVALAVRRGDAYRVITMHAGVLDLSRRGDVAEVARRLGRRDVES